MCLTLNPAAIMYRILYKKRRQFRLKKHRYFQSGTEPFNYPNGSYYYDRYNHYQNSLDFNGENYKLKGGKESPYEGGHRIPLMIRYPPLIQKPRVLARVHIVGLGQKVKCYRFGSFPNYRTCGMSHA